MIDVYQLAGVETPELSLLSEEFLDSLAEKEKPNLQMGLLRRLLNDRSAQCSGRTSCRAQVLRAARRGDQPLHEPIADYGRNHCGACEACEDHAC